MFSASKTGPHIFFWNICDVADHLLTLGVLITMVSSVRCQGTAVSYFNIGGGTILLRRVTEVLSSRSAINLHSARSHEFQEAHSTVT